MPNSFQCLVEQMQLSVSGFYFKSSSCTDEIDGNNEMVTRLTDPFQVLF